MRKLLLFMLYLSFSLISTKIIYAQQFNPMLLNFIQKTEKKKLTLKHFENKTISGSTNILEKTKRPELIEENATEENIKTQEEKVTYNSTIEMIYNDRKKVFEIKQDLNLFGYDFFQNRSYALNIFAPVDKNYILGPGDELFVYIIGTPPGINISQASKLIVDREGKIYIPGLGVFYVWGLPIKEAEKIISNAIKANIKLTVGRLRTFPVYVSGEVNNPGTVLVTGVNTVIDAISFAGGIKKSGSLRNIKLIRKEGGRIVKTNIDFYKLFIYGIPPDLRLKDADTIFVPPIGKTVAIAGAVKRPGIYEIKKESYKKIIKEFASGTLPNANPSNIIVQGYKNNSLTLQSILPADLNNRAKDGDFIYIPYSSNVTFNFVKIEGFYPTKGTIAFKEGLKLSDFIKPQLLFPDTDLSFAQVERYDPKTLRLSNIIKFSPRDVIEGRFDLKLKPMDRIRLFPKYPQDPVLVTGFVKERILIPYYPELTLSKAISKAKLALPASELKATIFRKDSSTTVMLSKLLAGEYQEDMELQPGDVILISKLEKETNIYVKIAGSVKFPGTYSIKEGARLYDIIKLAGGFTKNAFPEGIIIKRQKLKRLQQQKIAKAIFELKKQVEETKARLYKLSEISEEERKRIEFEVKAKEKLVEALENATASGRIVGLDIPHDLEKLKDSPYNILLADEDEIFIPQKPSSVLVFGEVYNPNAVIYKKGLSVRDYIKLCGGLSKYADEDNIFVIKANGATVSNHKEEVITWDKSKNMFVIASSIQNYIPQPGDAIIVPLKVHVPIMWRPFLKDVVQIMYQSALTIYTLSQM